jgi:hypothetical protein
MNKKLWAVTVIRTAIGIHYCQVEAETEEEAHRKAVENAANTVISEKDAEYSVEHCEEVTE